MWYITKGNSRRVRDLFYNRYERRKSKMWFYPGDSEKSMETAALFLVLHDHIQKYPSLEEALKHTSEAFASLRHFEDAIKKVKGQKEIKPEEKINLSHYR